MISGLLLFYIGSSLIAFSIFGAIMVIVYLMTKELNRLWKRREFGELFVMFGLCSLGAGMLFAVIGKILLDFSK